MVKNCSPNTNGFKFILSKLRKNNPFRKNLLWLRCYNDLWNYPKQKKQNIRRTLPPHKISMLPTARQWSSVPEKWLKAVAMGSVPLVVALYEQVIERMWVIKICFQCRKEYLNTDLSRTYQIQLNRKIPLTFFDSYRATYHESNISIKRAERIIKPVARFTKSSRREKKKVTCCSPWFQFVVDACHQEQ